MAPTRMLFTSRPLAGHFEPLVPLAVAARAAGHTVAFATGEPYTSRARQAGFDAFHAGPDEGFRNEWAPRFPGFDQLVGDAQRHFFLTEIFANLELVPRADDLDSIIDTWQPDVIVHEVAELAAPLVATAHGIPYVDLSYGSLIGSSLLRAAGEAAAPHWRARGLRTTSSGWPVPLPVRRHVSAFVAVAGDRISCCGAATSACRRRTAPMSTRQIGSIGSTRPPSST